MRYIYLLIFLLLTLTSCSDHSGKDNNKISFHNNINFNNRDLLREETFLTDLSVRDSLVRAVILRVTDTICQYTANMKDWPSESVEASINDYWEKQNKYPYLRKQPTNPVLEFMTDTARLHRFFEFIPLTDNSTADLVLIGDFKSVYYKYLAKKYSERLVVSYTSINTHESVQEGYDSWENLVKHSELAVDSVVMGPDLYLFREYNKVECMADMFENRLITISSLHFILTNPEFSVKVISENNYTIEDLNKKFNEIISMIDDPKSKDILTKQLKAWQRWYNYGIFGKTILKNKEQKKEYDKFLRNLVYSEWVFLNKVENSILTAPY